MVMQVKIHGNQSQRLMAKVGKDQRFTVSKMIQVNVLQSAERFKLKIYCQR